MIFVIIICVLTIFAIYLQFKNICLVKNIAKERQNEKQKQSFLANLVHDLKTPTNAQINTLKLLNNEVFGALNSEQREMITLTQNSCKYMSDLIGTIMDTYTYENGEVQLQKTNFDIVELIIEIIESLKVLTNHNNQVIEFRKEYKDCIVYADRLQIKRVISNLLANAITYGFDNTIITINLKLTRNVEISIKNISKQIPENELKTVFDKYQKTRYANYNKTGNGLGLYLSKRIIELHNGIIYAKSFEDGTCVFGFKIPSSVDNNPQLLKA